MKANTNNVVAGTALALALAMSNPVMTPAVEVMDQMGANTIALVPQAPAERKLGIGATSSAFKGADGEGTVPIFVLGAIGAASIVSRSGSNGLTLSSGGWDRNKDTNPVPKRQNKGRSPGRGAPTTPNGVEKVRFPVDGGPGRSAAGQQGAGLLLAGFFPTILEISRVMNLGMSA